MVRSEAVVRLIILGWVVYRSIILLCTIIQIGPEVLDITRK